MCKNSTGPWFIKNIYQRCHASHNVCVPLNSEIGHTQQKGLSITLTHH